MINQERNRIRKIVTLALFCAMAFLCILLLHFKVSFLTFDAKDALITICGMLFGPLYALILPFTVSLLEFLTISDTGLYGFLMNFVSSMMFSCAASLLYRARKTMTGAVLGLLSGIFAMTVSMLLMNLWITPYFAGCTVEDVIKMIPTLLLPFNVIKALLNAALVLVLYKPVSTALQHARLIEGHTAPYRMDRRSVAVLVIGLLLITACVILFLTVLNGSFSLYS